MSATSWRMRLAASRYDEPAVSGVPRLTATCHAGSTGAVIQDRPSSRPRRRLSRGGTRHRRVRTGRRRPQKLSAGSGFDARIMAKDVFDARNVSTAGTFSTLDTLFPYLDHPGRTFRESLQVAIRGGGACWWPPFPHPPVSSVCATCDDESTGRDGPGQRLPGEFVVRSVGHECDGGRRGTTE
jgi:hypothetical protein